MRKRLFWIYWGMRIQKLKILDPRLRGDDNSLVSRGFESSCIFPPGITFSCVFAGMQALVFLCGDEGSSVSIGYECFFFFLGMTILLLNCCFVYLNDTHFFHSP